MGALEKAIKKAKVDDYEIFLQERKTFHAESREETLFSLQEAFERGIAVRLFREGRCGFAHGNNATLEGLERLIALARQNLAALDKEVPFQLPQDPLAGKILAPFDETLDSYSPQQKFEQARHMEREARKTDPRVVRVRAARYEEEVKEVFLKNSSGVDSSYKTSLCEVSLMVVAEEGGKQESGWESDFAPNFQQLDSARVGRQAALRAVSLLGARPIKTQSAKALLDPVVGSSLLGVLSASLLGDQVRKDRSTLKGRCGTSVYSPWITLIDDPTESRGFFQAPFDAEGIVAQRKKVVEKGVLKCFLYDVEAAFLDRVPSTGNSVRPVYKEPPRVGVTNFFVLPGQPTQEDLLDHMGEGFWITDLIGVHTADPVTGDFSLGATGYWVSQGRRAFPVRGVAVSGNLHELLRRVEGVGNDLRFFNNYGSPSLLLSLIDIGGS